ncbi:MAG: tRNA pseudouridine(13) synthase TruD [bacterium]|nr:tRNA pseudouridine(13) synthase TruD [bacterium]
MSSVRFIPPLEKYIGACAYLIKTYPAFGKIKQSPEDFYVEEIIEPLKKRKSGRYLIVKILKKGWDTIKLAHYIARVCGISPKQVTYCGIKDKHALTVQHFCLEGVDERALSLLSRLKDVEVLEWYFSDEKLWLGKLRGNKFRIIIKEIKYIDNFIEACELVRKEGFLNLYGLQRFGIQRPNTHLVGRLLLQEAYEQAFWELVCRSYPGEQEAVREARKLAAEGRLEEFLRQAPSCLFYERLLVRYYLRWRDYRKAFRKLPYDYRSLFLHAYQAYLFNRIASLCCEFGELPPELEISARAPLCRYFLEEDNVRLENARKLGIRLRALRRKTVVRPEAFKYKILSNTSAQLEFILPPGTYATSLIREICKNEYW